MKSRHRNALLAGLLTALAGLLFSQSSPPPQNTTPAAAPPKKAAPKAAPVTPVLTNQDIIKLVKAKLSDDLIIQKIAQSKTRFDTSVDGLVALRDAGVDDRLLAVIMNPASAAAAAPAARPAATPSANPPPAPAPASTLPPKPSFGPDQTRPREVAATVTNSAKTPAARPVEVGAAPPNYGVYIADHGELKPLGRIQTKVQISKLRSLLRTYIPFVRQKIDINIPGAHSTSRFEASRPTFFAYFPPSRDASKFKLLQCKITGQNFDQRTVANASIMFSTEQNQDEVPCDIGPTSVKDLYRIFPREDLPAGEFGFVEGNTGSKSTSNIEILDVYDFGVDRKEEKLPLKDYLDTLPAASIADRSFLESSREDCKIIVDDREGSVGITGALLGWFKRQYASLDVYWADPKFVKAFARLEMLERDLSGDQAAKLASTLLSTDGSQYYILVSIGGKIGSGRLIGANEGERLMRPFDASLTNDKGKDIVPAKRLEFVGGYAGLWKVTFDTKSLRGPVLNNESKNAIFEARLNQNLDFKAKFLTDKIMDIETPASAPANPAR
ncbi:MAG: hypothetical protein ABSC05_03755 [Candidatus Solibacter sp.]